MTTDNYFIFMPLANSLVKNHRLPIIGTVRKNKPQVPRELLEVKQKNRFLAFGDKPNNCLLFSYVPTPNRNVFLLSTMHTDEKIDQTTGKACKPEVITEYNLTKGEVDVVDKIEAEYSVTRFNNR